jgi:DnaJ-domain-containing protein 1
MLLPGRLKATTLGDLLGALHRAAATGTLELVEDRGRSHRIHVSSGLVVAVELDGAAASLAELLRKDRAVDDDVLRRSLLRAMASRKLHGEVLVDEFRLSPTVVGLALRRQLLVRLASLEQLADARIAFRVAVRTPRGALHQQPLEAREFLHGRRRARERQRELAPAAAEDFSSWSVLGLSPGAAPAVIKQAYRRLARSVHPDLHPQATPEERRALELRFSRIHEAYRALVA